MITYLMHHCALSADHDVMSCVTHSVYIKLVEYGYRVRTEH